MNDGKYLVIIRKGKWIDRRNLFLKMKPYNIRCFDQGSFNKMTIIRTVRDQNISGTMISNILQQIRKESIVGIVLIGLKPKNTEKLKIAVHNI